MGNVRHIIRHGHGSVACGCWLVVLKLVESTSLTHHRHVDIDL
jgi:hypothetical protein